MSTLFWSHNEKSKKGCRDFIIKTKRRVFYSVLGLSSLKSKPIAVKG